jgi:hypothetical protein
MTVPPSKREHLYQGFFSTLLVGWSGIASSEEAVSLVTAWGLVGQVVL